MEIIYKENFDYKENCTRTHVSYEVDLKVSITNAN